MSMRIWGRAIEIAKNKLLRFCDLTPKVGQNNTQQRHVQAIVAPPPLTNHPLVSA